MSKNGKKKWDYFMYGRITGLRTVKGTDIDYQAWDEDENDEESEKYKTSTNALHYASKRGRSDRGKDQIPHDLAFLQGEVKNKRPKRPMRPAKWKKYCGYRQNTTLPPPLSDRSMRPISAPYAPQGGLTAEKETKEMRILREQDHRIFEKALDGGGIM